MGTNPQLNKDNNAIDAKRFSESGASEYYFYVKGTAYNNLANRVLSVNGTSIYNTTGRGMRLTIINSSTAAVTHDLRYDLYLGDTTKDALATKLNAMTSTDLFFMTSYDWIGGNTNLNAAMSTLNSWNWSSAIQTGGRYPYACAGLGRTGILSEQSWGSSATDPFAEFTFNYQDYDSSGVCGYGPELAGLLPSTVPEFSYTGTGYGIKFSDYINYSDIDLADQEYVRLTFEVKVDEVRRAAGGSCRVYVYSNSTTDSWIASSSYPGTNTEWEKREIRFKRNDATLGTDSNPATRIRVGVYHYPSTIDDGTSYVRNIELQKAGFSPTDTELQTRFSNYTVGTKRIVESPGTFHPNYPQEYYDLWNSDKNLDKNTAVGGLFYGTTPADEDVQWLDRTLTTNTQKFIMWKENGTTTGANMIKYLATHDIDPNKMYYQAIWVKNFFKSAGNIYLGTHGYNSATSNIGVYYANTGVNNTNPYSWITADESLTNDRWMLLEQWYLPSWTDNTYGTWFRSNVSNREFGHVDNGGWHERYLGTRNVWRFRTDNAQIRGRLLDYYNDVQDTKTYFALPILVEVPVMSIGSDGTLYGNLLRETL